MKVDNLLQQLLKQSISRLEFENMRDLNLSDIQRRHIKNLEQQYLITKIETKSKITL